MARRYVTDDWRDHAARLNSGRSKRAIYGLLRPLLSQVARRQLSPETLRELRPTLVLPERGFPLETRRRWATSGRPLTKQTVLVQGTGTGWDVVSWAERRPRRIIATDLFEFSESWAEIRRHCSEQFGVEVSFIQAALEDHSFLADGEVDLCASDAVYEHCVDLEAVMKETRRVLHPQGTVYATYGPLWFTAAGDHFSGRGGLSQVFNHVALGKDEYSSYFDEHLESSEDAQSGGRYVPLGLFSRLTTAEYLAVFRGAGFSIDALVLETSRLAREFARQYPEAFRRLAERHRPRCTTDDFIIKTNFVRLTCP